MFSINEIERLFGCLNEKLKKADKKGEICIVGGAAMMLLFNNRPSTRDIDGVFAPTDFFREIIEEISEEEELPLDWLNDGVKGFLMSDFKEVAIWEGSHLQVYSPEAEYLLAMKVMSSRVGTSDEEDILTLIKHLNITKASEVFDITEKYFSNRPKEAKCQYFIQEIIEKIN